MTNSRKLTIYSKMNVYYCNGSNKPIIIANSIRDLFNNENAKKFLPKNTKEFKKLKKSIYFYVSDENLVSVDYKLSFKYNIFICKNSLLSQLMEFWGFSEQEAKEHFTNYITENDNNKRIWENIVDICNQY